MKNNLVLIMLCFMVFLKCAVLETQQDINLTDTSFKNSLEINPNVFVLFYVPFCPQCKKLLPEFAKAAIVLKDSDYPVLMAKIDVSENKKIKELYKIDAYPTIKLFTNNAVLDYTGNRREKDIVLWLKKKIGPISHDIQNLDQLNKFKKELERFIIYFGDTLSDRFTTFKSASEHYEGLIFAHSNNKEIKNHLSITNDSVIFFKNFDEGQKNFDGELNEETLKKFIEENYYPLILNFDDTSAQIIFGQNIPAIFLFRESNTHKLIEEIFTSVASKFKGKLQFVITDTKSQVEMKLASLVGLTLSEIPTIKICDTRNKLRKFNFGKQPITEENLLNFVEDWENDKLIPYLKSQEIVEKSNEVILTLVGMSFENVVYDDTKDVLVLFHTLSCKSCEKVIHLLEQVAKTLNHNSNLLITKIDTRLNELEKIEVDSTPSILMFGAGKKESPIIYKDIEKINIQEIIKFIEKNVSFPIKVKVDL